MPAATVTPIQSTVADFLQEVYCDGVPLSGGQYAAALVQAERLVGLNQFGQAALLYRILILADPSKPAPHRSLGICLERLNRLAEAADSLNRALALDPGDARALLARAGLRARNGNRGGARADAEAALPLVPAANAALRRRAQILIRTCATHVAETTHSASETH